MKYTLRDFKQGDNFKVVGSNYVYQVERFTTEVPCLVPIGHPDLRFNLNLVDIIKLTSEQTQAIKNGEVKYCENCKEVQPIELTCYNPHSDEEPNLLACMICKEAIGFIEAL